MVAFALMDLQRLLKTLAKDSRHHAHLSRKFSSLRPPQPYRLPASTAQALPPLVHPPTAHRSFAAASTAPADCKGSIRLHRHPLVPALA